MANRRKKKKTAGQKAAKIFTIIGVLGVIAFGVREYVSYSQNPFIVKWRNIYIETAVTTHSHQWLATLVFPRSVVNQVVANINAQTLAQENMESTWKNGETDANKNLSGKEWFTNVYWELDSPSVNEYIEQNPSCIASGYENLKIDNLDGELDIFTAKGDRVLVVDCANNIFLTAVQGDGYVGKMAFVKEPAQVKHVLSKSFGSYGEEIEDFGDSYGALIAINASPFEDVGGHGSGAIIRGSCIIDGKEYGHPNSMKLYAMNFDDLLYVTNYSKDTVSQYRWGVQFFPALIIDGENVLTSDSGGNGIQPRTIIGQQANKTFMMLIIDGRQVGYSLGATVGECATIMERYNAVQAGALDGGSSAVMYYNGDLITKSSSVSGRGRYCPDSLIVIPASQKDNWTDEYSDFPN
ncbi:MAG: phosphodiester glycosidase family protein [Agathobacter sp.]|uniref:phosphodiester glycosidase family protein n=1 Tax=Agathobacter sp. TaxID=2021311 RepID=UPI00258FED8C|nr:phosphodiester glycosidase family protein [Agathobacter sp.]MCR5678169.1 phosphodiester glycosidase family protein [Agathobacter sp.]